MTRKLSQGVWDEREARDYLELLLNAVAHAKQVRALFMDVLLTHDEQQSRYDELAALAAATLARVELTPADLRAVHAQSLYQPNLSNSLWLLGHPGLLEPHPGWEASGRANRALPTRDEPG